MTIEKKIEELKNRFSVGKIPTEADFGKLIDLANEANSLLGIDTKADISNSKLLNGLEVKNKELQVKIAKNSGLKVDENGISINTGSGISVDDNGVHLNVTAGKGITITKENVIEVAPWSGIGINNKGDIELRVGTGLSVGEEGVKLKIGDGLTSNSNGQLTINIPPNQPSGLISDANGLRINLISADNATTPGKENFLTLNGAGQLGLTTEGLNRIKEGSKSKFNTALAAAVGKAVAEKKVAPDFADTLGENDSWDAPITSLVDAATSYTSAEKAKERLTKKLIDYLADPKKVAVRPTNDNIRINYSVKMGTTALYYGVNYFSLDTLVTFWSDGDEITYDTPKKLSDNYAVNAENFTQPGFYAFAGKLTAPGQEAIKNANGNHLTANAIMVYIGAENFFYTVGYWDLSTEKLDFYQFEADPSNDIDTRNDSPLLTTSLDIVKTISEESTKNTFPLNVTGGNGTPIIYTISESQNKNLIVDTATGICTFTEWSPTPITITVSDSPTRTKYSSKPLNFKITIKAIEGVPLSATATSSFFLRNKKDHEVKLSDFIIGRDSEYGKLLSLKYVTGDPNIVTVDNDGQLTINNYGDKTFILVTQKKTSLHAEKTYKYGVEVDKDPTRKDPNIQFKFDRLYGPNRYFLLISANNTETIKISCQFYDKDKLHTGNFDLKLNYIGIEGNFLKYICDFVGVEIPEVTKYINFHLWQDESDNFNSWADESGLISTFD